MTVDDYDIEMSQITFRALFTIELINNDLHTSKFVFLFYICGFGLVREVLGFVPIFYKILSVLMAYR